MIEEVRKYIAKCPYLKEYGELNVEYLVDKVNTYSINESAGYEPIISEDIVGNQKKKFLFTFDSKLRWNEDIQNNIDNSKFFENFRDWLEDNNNMKKFPDIQGVYKIEALTNGYIHATNANQAIYRIQCQIEYLKRRKK